MLTEDTQKLDHHQNTKTGSPSEHENPVCSHRFTGDGKSLNQAHQYHPEEDPYQPAESANSQRAFWGTDPTT